MFTLRENMRFLWLYLFLQTVLWEGGSSSSYYGRYRICNKWSCLNDKLNFDDELPPIREYKDVLKDGLPDYWQDIADTAVEYCYSIDLTKQFSNPCPGQSLMHCVMHKFVELCPTSDEHASDACGTVVTMADSNYMFTQSRYQNLSQNFPTDIGSAITVRDFFKTKCCSIPKLFRKGLLTECGFKKFLHYYDRAQFFQNKPGILLTHVTTTEKNDVENSSYDITSESTNHETINPLDCCELNDFIHPEWRSECGFKMTWDATNRLMIEKDTEVTTTTERVQVNDIVIKQMPVSCEKLQCVFGKLNIVSQDGDVDRKAYTNLLDEMVKLHPIFTDAKKRVEIICLRRPPLAYDGACEIHKLLSCTFDVLSENCPTDEKDDLCKFFTPNSDFKCQVSSSKYGFGIRRQFCNLPELVGGKPMSDCGLTSISVIHTEPVKYKAHLKTNIIGSCTQLTKSTSCVLNKMGALNQYGFMDHFKMKDRIRQYSDGLTSNFYDFYSSALQNTPFYCRHCISPRKFLSVLDSMLMICPIPKRNTSEQCNKIYNDLWKFIPDDVTRRRLHEMLREFQNVYFPIPNEKKSNSTQTSVRNYNLYDFGLLGSKNAPPVEIIDLKPTTNTLVLLPVYQRKLKDPLALTSLHNDDILRG